MINCLLRVLPPEGRAIYELVEGETLSTFCIVTGNPKPFLQCYLLNNTGKVDNGQITRKEKRNFSQAILKPLQFFNVRRTVSHIECEADSGEHARKTVRSTVGVDYKPGPPAKIEAIKITYTSIKFRWTAPREPGRSKIHAYRLLAEHPNGAKRLWNFRVPATRLEYTFRHLQRDVSYQVSVAASNKAGQGESMRAYFTTSRKVTVLDTGTELTMEEIIGFGAGGLVALLALFTIVFCVKKQKKKKKRKREAAEANRQG
eukprot:Seg1582.3 transcript_id=Seg1582.3/GoldUCD/mRNA.D3Y31 product=Titin protein_id=Seg1582.3/GoldUCD/D3Y31